MIRNRLTRLMIFMMIGHMSYGQKPDSLLRVLAASKDTNRVKVLHELSKCFSNRDNEKALGYSQQAYAYAKKIKNNKFIAQSAVLLGHEYNSVGNYSEALVYLLEGFKIFRDNNMDRGASRAANAIGNNYLGQENYKKAAEYYGEVVKFAAKSGDEYSQALGNLGMSNALAHTDNSKALIYIEKAEEGFKKINATFESLVATMNKGSIQADLNQHQKAYNTFMSALSESEALGDKYLVSSVYLNIGNTLRPLKRYDESLDYLRKAHNMNIELKADDNLKDIYLAMSRTFQEARKPDSALFYLNAHINLKDSLLQSQRLKDMNELEAKYQLENKNAQLKANAAKMEEHEAKIRANKAEEARSTLLRNGLLVGLALTIIFLIFVYRSNIQRKKAYKEVSMQKAIIEQKNHEILDSIEYAKRIQKTLLASDTFLKKQLNDHFIFYKPKDIVSGDFYWASEITDERGQKNFMLCTADCTGHGVPGAFMSLLCISFLNEITRDSRIIKPNEVFTRLKQEIVLALNPEEAVHTQDGMDAVLCRFDFHNLKMQLSCANNPVIIVRNEEIIEIKPDKNPIGKNERTGYDYTLHQLDLQKGDLVYTFTDGYADQFGGETGKKFKYKQFKEMLFKNRFLSMSEQKTKLETTIETWKGKLEQLDDILVIGIRV